MFFIFLFVNMNEWISVRMCLCIYQVLLDS